MVWEEKEKEELIQEFQIHNAPMVCPTCSSHLAPHTLARDPEI